MLLLMLLRVLRLLPLGVRWDGLLIMLLGLHALLLRELLLGLHVLLLPLLRITPWRLQWYLPRSRRVLEGGLLLYIPWVLVIHPSIGAHYPPLVGGEYLRICLP